MPARTIVAGPSFAALRTRTRRLAIIGAMAAAATTSFTQMTALAQAGATVRPLALQPPDWRLREDVIAAAISERTRVLLLNSPHNPTGRVLDTDELGLLADACRRHDLLAITDEVYEHLVYDGRH